jgi:hypothetical protein
MALIEEEEEEEERKKKKKSKRNWLVRLHALHLHLPLLFS